MHVLDAVKSNVDRAIKDIKNILSANGGKGVAHYSTYILASCIIDYLAGYRYEGQLKKQGDKYKKFIREYLKKVDERYDDKDLYHHLRCGLVHSFSEFYDGKAKYYFWHLAGKLHLTEKELKLGKRIILDIHCFIEDIKKARDLYLEEAAKSLDLQKIMLKRIKKVGVLKTDIPITFKLSDIKNIQDLKKE